MQYLVSCRRTRQTLSESSEALWCLSCCIVGCFQQTSSCLYQAELNITSIKSHQLLVTLTYTMTVPYKEIATAKPFRFLIGDAAVEFFVHPAIVAQQSKSLATLIHGKMKEARDGYACIEDVDVDTFARFVEYCYTEDYAAAEHACTAFDGIESMDKPEDKIEEFQRTLGKRCRKTSSVSSGLTRRQEMWNTFTELSCDTPAQVPKPPQYSARPNEQACEDYTDVFLSHARLYVFADTYGIEGLRVLSLQKLRQSLVNFTLYAERTTDIALLLQYAYQHIPERTGTMDHLRELLMRYVCCHLDEIRRNDVFKEMLKAENNLSVDLLELLVPSLH